MLDTVKKDEEVVKKFFDKGDILVFRKIVNSDWLNTINRVNRNEGGDGEIKGTYTRMDGSMSKVDICAPIDYRTGYLKKFLTDEDQTWVAAELGLQKEKLNTDSDFWVDYVFSFKGTQITLDTNNPKDYLNVLMLAACDQVNIPGVVKTRNKYFHEAIYEIVSVKNEFKLKAEKIKYKREAYVAMGSMTFDEKVDILNMLGSKPTNMTSDSIDTMLGLQIDTNAKRIYNIYTNPKFKNLALMTRWLSKGVLTKASDGNIFYYDKKLGELEEAIKFLNNPKNSTTLEAIKESYKEKTESK